MHAHIVTKGVFACFDSGLTDEDGEPVNVEILAVAWNGQRLVFDSDKHVPSVALAERLVEVTPGGLDRVFYSDNGSAAVEVALKTSFHYWRNTGHGEKTRFINLPNSYHGDLLHAALCHHAGTDRSPGGRGRRGHRSARLDLNRTRC